MKLKYPAILITALLCLVMAAWSPVKTDSYVIIKDVSIIPMDREQVLEHHSILIKNGKIEKIVASPDLNFPFDAIIIDGRGKFLMPGLSDMHTHFFYEQGDNRNTCEAELSVMLANGITTARIMCGDSVYLDARKAVRNGMWPGPELYVVSPQFVGKWPWPGKVFGAICTTPKEAEDAVKRFKREGYDEIKITFMVKADVYDAIVKAAKEQRIKVTGHVGPLAGLPRALKAKEQIEHMDEFIEVLLPDTSYNHGMSVSDMGVWKKANWATVDYLDESRIPLLVQQVKAAGIYVTPTNYFFVSCFGTGMSEEAIHQKPDFEFIPDSIREERWDIRQRYHERRFPEATRAKYVHLRHAMTKALWQGGVKLMAGSDSPEWFLVQGFALHNELQEFVNAGLTPYAALETATINPATYLGTDKRRGTIAVGKDADLLLLDANPLENIANTSKINTVLRNGKVYSRQQLDEMLNAAKTILRG